MTRILNRLICLSLGVLAAGNAAGFSLWGPAETWQTQQLDYGIRYLPAYPIPDLDILNVSGPGIGPISPEDAELGGTKNISEGSRLNVPIITYGFDYTFLSYFGTKGEAAVDQAFAILNGLPPASSADLNTFITQGNQQVNYTAQALKMLDIKSTVLWVMMEHMGLIGETHTYDLRERVAPNGGTGCDYDYAVIVRNFDPVTYAPSPYVNGTLLTYQIGELCPGLQVGDAMEETAQVGTPSFSAVATREALEVGGYYLRITRDDMGGLRYLYRKNRYVNEGFDANTTVTSEAGGTYSPINLTATNGVGGIFAGLLGGVEKINFVKTPYDSVEGDTFTPITYRYAIPTVTNGVVRTLTVTRTITAPDIIFTAGDLTYPGPDPYQVTIQRSSGFITYGAAPSPGVNTVSPSVITPEMVVTFNNSGQVTYNESGSFTDQANSAELGYIWGSFDGSTNAPVAFPTGTSLAGLVNQVMSAGAETELGLYTPIATGTNSTNTTTTATSTTSP